VQSFEEWMTDARRELAGAADWWEQGNAGRGRVGARRAAGMAFKARLVREPRPGYGTSFMHHLNAAADDPDLPIVLREAAWRLAARPTPEAGWTVPLPKGLTPMDDARLALTWAAELAAVH
jgi:hypothetical protein